jgi:transcriptional regulator with XRE-family HTH domain
VTERNQEFVRLLAESGWSVKECATALGVTGGAISQFRSGHTVPSLTLLRLFSGISGIPLRLAGEPEPLKVENLQPWERRALEGLRNLPTGVRTQYIDHISKLAAELKGGQKVTEKIRELDPAELELNERPPALTNNPNLKGAYGRVAKAATSAGAAAVRIAKAEAKEKK